MISKHSAQYSVITDQIQVIVQNQLDLDSLPGPEQTADQLGADSLDLVEIEMGIEELFGIIIPAGKSNEWKTIEELADIVKELI
jgi:acyl carrier protein